jgi:hypothetical protein
MAVGPLEPVLLCATGATVALPRRHCNAQLEAIGVAEGDTVARCAARTIGARIAIAGDRVPEAEEGDDVKTSVTDTKGSCEISL